MLPNPLIPPPGIKWHEVTWYSKLGAAVLFLGVVPALCFYIGVQYKFVFFETLLVRPTAGVLVSHDSRYFVDQEINKKLQECLGAGPNTLGIQDCYAAAVSSYHAVLDQKVASVQASLDTDINDFPVDTKSLAQAKEDLKTSQTAWKAYVRAACDRAYHEWQGGSGRVAGYSGCELILTQARIYDVCETSNGPTTSRCERVSAKKIAADSQCAPFIASYEPTFNAKSLFAATSSPTYHFNTRLQACVGLFGITYPDHGGESFESFVTNLNTGETILKGSDDVRYFNDAAYYYVDPVKNNVITNKPQFDQQAQVLMTE